VQLPERDALGLGGGQHEGQIEGRNVLRVHRAARQLGVEVALRGQPRLAERAAPQPDLAVAIRVLPVDERDPDLRPVEQAGADLVLHDAALGEHAD
jgi:hypothetical protein